jgi:hypothetical protein
LRLLLFFIASIVLSPAEKEYCCVSDAQRISCLIPLSGIDRKGREHGQQESEGGDRGDSVGGPQQLLLYVNRPSNGAQGSTAYHSDKADQEKQLVCALLQYSYLMDIHERAALRAPVHISLSSAEPEDDALVRAPVHT